MTWLNPKRVWGCHPPLFRQQRLTQLADDLSQAGFVAVGVFLVNQVIPGSLIEKRGDLAVFFGRFLFIRLAAQFFDSGPELRAQGFVSEALFV